MPSTADIQSFAPDTAAGITPEFTVGRSGTADHTVTLGRSGDRPRARHVCPKAHTAVVRLR
jgi:hypothetical protein